MNKGKIEYNHDDQYMTHSEMKMFNIDCPVCGITTSLSDFSEHLRKDAEGIKDNTIRDL